MFLMCLTFAINIFSEYLNQSNQLNEIFIKFWLCPPVKFWFSINNLESIKLNLNKVLN